MLDLSSSLQDYLEAILELSEVNSTVRVTDLAKKLNIAKASVSQSISKLVDLNLVQQESYGPIELTSTGREQALKVRRRHRMLRKFLIEILGVKPEIAEKDACKMEHTISPETMDKLVDFLAASEQLPQEEPKMTTQLSQLKKGQTGTVTKIEATGTLRRRISELGVNVGTKITVLGVAPMGDPMEFSVQDYRLSLRKDEASLIRVEVDQ